MVTSGSTTSSSSCSEDFKGRSTGLATLHQLEDERRDSDDDDDYDEDSLEEAPRHGDSSLEEAATSGGMHEQLYQERVAHLKEELRKLAAGSLPELLRRRRRLDTALEERLFLSETSLAAELAGVERDFQEEVAGAERELRAKRLELRECLLAELEERRRQLGAERAATELDGGVAVDPAAGLNPTSTRKLRMRRAAAAGAGEVGGAPEPELGAGFDLSLGGSRLPAPAQGDAGPAARRRKLAGGGAAASGGGTVGGLHHVNYMLEETDIYEDLKLLQRVCGKRVLVAANGAAAGTGLPPGEPASGSVDSDEPRVARVSDSLLYYDDRCFHAGCTVAVDSRDGTLRCAGVISHVSQQEVLVKRSTDGGKVRVYVSHLRSGKVTLKKRS